MLSRGELLVERSSLVVSGTSPTSINSALPESMVSSSGVSTSTGLLLMKSNPPTAGSSPTDLDN
jgi:hypothetical protein